MSAEPTKPTKSAAKAAAETTANSTHGTTEATAQATAHHHLSWCLNRIHGRLDLVKSLLHVLSR